VRILINEGAGSRPKPANDYGISGISKEPGGAGQNMWGCREQFSGLRRTSTDRHLNLFWKNVTTKSRWPSWSKALVSGHGFESCMKVRIFRGAEVG